MSNGLGTQTWHQAYGDDAARARRRMQMPVKLEKLGVSAIARDTAVLDLCCGNGEALDALFDLGFSSLWGLDMAVDPRVLADPRFHVTVGDALTAPVDRRFGWITFLHAMHHFETADKAVALLDRCVELLEPGGRLSIVDFPNSPQIQAAFWFFRQKRLLVTPYLKNFGALIEEEWPFLRGYLPQFPQIDRWLHSGKLAIEVERRELFYFYITLRKN
jgi:SAM-dependent methyltransferase